MKKLPPKLKKKRLLLHYLDYTNKTHKSGKLELPSVLCNTDVLPDYIALYSHVADYCHTSKTAIAFFQFDDVFDGEHGLYNAIYYKNCKNLKKFKERFKNIHFAIAPDCSECGDVDLIENLYRLKRARVISLWFTIELGICVIPLITFPNLEFLHFVLEGLKNCSVVAFSTKGYVNNVVEREILVKAIKETIDTLNLKHIVVYDVCKDNDKALTLFEYAIQKGINVVIPDNMLKFRNKVNKKNHKGGHYE